MIITITKLEKKGWAYLDRLKGREEKKGYVLSAEDRKLWLRSYSTETNSTEKDGDLIVKFADDLQLEIPALQNRFW